MSPMGNQQTNLHLLLFNVYWLMILMGSVDTLNTRLIPLTFMLPLGVIHKGRPAKTRISISRPPSVRKKQ